jgi:hypothetical protein
MFLHLCGDRGGRRHASTTHATGKPDAARMCGRKCRVIMAHRASGARCMGPAPQGFPQARAGSARAHVAAARARRPVRRPPGQRLRCRRRCGRRDRRQAQPEERAGVGRRGEEHVAGLDQHAVPAGDARQLAAVHPGRCGAPRATPRLAAWRDLEVGQVLASPAAASCQPFLHHLVDAPRVRLVVPERHEQRIGLLQEGAGVAHHRMAQQPQFGHQRTRRDDVAQPQRRRQALGQRADVDHAADLSRLFSAGIGVPSCRFSAS